MPPPVAGAMFLLVVSYNLIAGMQIIMSRMMETRHTYIIGFSLLFGLGAENMPDLAAQAPVFLRPLLSSGLDGGHGNGSGAECALPSGHAREDRPFSLPPSRNRLTLCANSSKVRGQWGARREVSPRAVSAMVEFFESVIVNELVTVGDVSVSAFFDEYRLDFAIRYRGEVLEIPPAGRRSPSIRIPPTFCAYPAICSPVWPIR